MRRFPSFQVSRWILGLLVLPVLAIGCGGNVDVDEPGDGGSDSGSNDETGGADDPCASGDCLVCEDSADGLPCATPGDACNGESYEPNLDDPNGGDLDCWITFNTCGEDFVWSVEVTGDPCI